MPEKIQHSSTAEAFAKEGFKHFPLGTIPLDWEVKRIGSIAMKI